MRNKCFISMAVAIIFMLLIAPLAVLAQAENTPVEKPAVPVVYTLQVEGMVTAGNSRHIERVIEQAQGKASAVVIILDTPGGLVSATLDIMKTMSASRVPVITYVNPEGAIAASAGTFILVAGHVAAMSPGTTCGAAMPVTMSTPGETTQPADQKTINFLAGHMRSIARERSKPADLAGKFVTDNLSMTANEALDAEVIDYLCPTLEELLESVEGKGVTTAAGKTIIHTSKAGIINFEMNLEEKATNSVSNPTVAMLLLMIGIFALTIAFKSPGTLVPEITGVICLLLALFGLGFFEINLAAGLFIIGGIALLIAEAFTPTFGILAVGGAVSLILGMIFFPVEPLMSRQWFSSFRIMALGVGSLGALFVTVALVGIYRAHRLRPFQGEAEFDEKTGIVVKSDPPYAQVKVQGEIWRAYAEENTLKPGDRVRILSRDGITLRVGLQSEHKDKVQE
ncbi:MAG: nodulation protein NfeD [Syntrophomonadaceae bacterium]|nr:nodulation protein NfeD [Syntrophomonadaceae bacterium]